MIARHFLPLAAALALATSLPAQTPPRTAPNLVPANYNPITDSLGTGAV